MTPARLVRRRPLTRLGTCPVCKLAFRVCANGAVLGHGGLRKRCRGSGRLPLTDWPRTVLDSIRTAENHLCLPWSRRLEPQSPARRPDDPRRAVPEMPAVVRVAAGAAAAPHRREALVSRLVCPVCGTPYRSAVLLRLHRIAAKH